MASNRLLFERSFSGDEEGSDTNRRLARSVTVNLAESPLGWLFFPRFCLATPI
jgi:hypothetical protein